MKIKCTNTKMDILENHTWRYVLYSLQTKGERGSKWNNDWEKQNEYYY